jgi:hypothetical protein
VTQTRAGDFSLILFAGIFCGGSFDARTPQKYRIASVLSSLLMNSVTPPGKTYAAKLTRDGAEFSLSLAERAEVRASVSTNLKPSTSVQFACTETKPASTYWPPFVWRQ